MAVSTLLVFAPLIQKVLTLGLDAYTNADGEWTAADLKRFQSGADILLGAHEASAKVARTPKVASLEGIFVVAAFSEALRQIWGPDSPIVKAQSTTGKLLATAETREQVQRIEEILSRSVSPEVAGLPVNLLEQNPIAHPGYKRLLVLFSRADLLNLRGDSKFAFEATYRLAWRSLLSSVRGKDLQEYLLKNADDHPEQLYRLLATDMAAWPQRHLFGGGEKHSYLPMMRMADFYVEPTAILEFSDAPGVRQGTGPVLSLLGDLIEDHPLILVTADFGHGKSLTARTWAARLAEDWLKAKSASTEVWLPLFARCAEDLRPGNEGPKEVQKRLLWRHLRSFGPNRKLDDAIFTPPGPSQRTITLLDGLDEVVLAESQRRDLFERLEEEQSDEHRFVVFTRPAVVPQSLGLRRVPILRLEGFSEKQIEDWLTQWNRNVQTGLTIQQLKERELATLAETPILLFMIAYGDWKSPNDGKPDQKSGIYERFFQQIARGKAEADSATHPQIAAAAEKLREELEKKDILEDGATNEDAMLWLMGRIAWKGEVLAAEKKELDVEDIKDVLRNELGLRQSDALAIIHVGLLLALQVNPTGDSSRILFGHRSFAEFLIARHWYYQLRRIVRATADERRRLERELYGAGILREQTEVVDFLVEMIDQDIEFRRNVLQWAQVVFNDESIDGEPATLRNDRRLYLREAALAVGSRLTGGGLSCKAAWIVQDLLSRFMMRGVRLWAVSYDDEPESINLFGAKLDSADFSGACLAGAYLGGVRFSKGKFMCANLSHAHLSNADLSGSDLFDANLTEAVLGGVNLTDAQLYQANLSYAYLEESNLSGVILYEANLTKADLSGCNLRGARLGRAKLHRVNLEYADLTNSILDYCDFTGANLTDADLTNADLTRANLTGAKLTNVDVTAVRSWCGAILDDVVGLDEATLAYVLERTRTDPK